RNGDKWQAAWHSETTIIDPKNPPKAPAAAPADKDAKPPAGDANTAAVLKIEQSGWDAWMAHDQAKLESILTNNLSIVGSEGGFYSGKADVIKYWMTPKCDVKSVSLTDATASALSPTLEILTYK